MSNEYFQIVLVNLFVKNTKLNHFSKLLNIYRHSTNSIKRKVILTGAQNSTTAWIRELKEDYDDASQEWEIYTRS